MQQHLAAVKLGEYAPQAPHVNLRVVRSAEDDLGRSIGSGLHVRREVVGDVAARAKVDDLDLAPAVALDQDVLGFQVAVYEIQRVKVLERRQQLPRDLLQRRQREVGLLARLEVVPLKLVQVRAEELGDDEEVLAMVEVVVHPQDALGVVRVLVVDVPQQLDLVQGLVEVVLVVLHNLEADDVAGVEVHSLHSLGERGASEVLRELVPPGDDVADSNREILLLLEARAVQPVDDWQVERHKRLIRVILLLVLVLHLIVADVREAIAGEIILALVAEVTVRPRRVERFATPHLHALLSLRFKIQPRLGWRRPVRVGVGPRPERVRRAVKRRASRRSRRRRRLPFLLPFPLLPVHFVASRRRATAKLAPAPSQRGTVRALARGRRGSVPSQAAAVAPRPAPAVDAQRRGLVKGEIGEGGRFVRFVHVKGVSSVCV